MENQTGTYTGTQAGSAPSQAQEQGTTRQFTVGILVNNHFGVLNRVAGLYAKRCYNIDSLAVGETEDPRFSRMTIVSTGDDYMREQVVKQLRKLYDVKAVVLFDREATVSLEHVLVKLHVDPAGSVGLSELVDRFSGKIKGFGPKYAVVEITGDTEKIEAFLESARPHGIIECCRSGRISMSHGLSNVMDLQDMHNR
ncbi:MAG: acetolactate synthase small subunit [Eggerthellaceae bacterium]|nr:acetolactate synthase small subunit [Eggerthellaceae bacterium]